MNERLKLIESICSSYMFHMLSVSKVGYDNDYGDKYQNYHDSSDLQILRKYTDYLTVEGGKHCGQLFVLLFGITSTYPSLDEMKVYLVSIQDIFETKDLIGDYPPFRNRFTGELISKDEEQKEFIEQIFQMFNEYSDPIIEITDVLIKNITIFQNLIYNETQTIVSEFSRNFSNTLSNYGDLMSLWEMSLSVNYKIPYFNVILLNSIDDGPQAIDINQVNDVFGINSNHEILVSFISHELGTYLIMENLTDRIKAELISYWNSIESLSTYLNSNVITKLRDNIGSDEYITWYSSNYEAYSKLSIEELVVLAKDEISKIKSMVK